MFGPPAMPRRVSSGIQRYQNGQRVSGGVGPKTQVCSCLPLLINKIVPLCFLLGTALMMLQLASVAEILEVSVRPGPKLEELTDSLSAHEFSQLDIRNLRLSGFDMFSLDKRRPTQELVNKHELALSKVVSQEQAVLDLEFVERDDQKGDDQEPDPRRIEELDQMHLVEDDEEAKANELGEFEVRMQDEVDEAEEDSQTIRAESAVANDGPNKQEIIKSEKKQDDSGHREDFGGGGGGGGSWRKQQDMDEEQRAMNEQQRSQEENQGEMGRIAREVRHFESVSGTFDGINVVLEPSVNLPKKPVVKAYNSDKNFWPWYKILKKQHGWSHGFGDVPDMRANMLFTKGAVPYLRKGKQMLNSIGVSGCIGGSKLLQLECRQRLALRHGCKYEDLGIQPAQYSLDTIDGCNALFEHAKRPENSEKLWLYKPSNTFHGKGIKLYKGPDQLWKVANHCRSTRSVIVMEYVSNPATMLGGYKFDLRSYLLVGSLDPQLVFYADGFARKSDTVYSRNSTRSTVHVTNSVQQKRQNHFFNFDQVGDALSEELGFPSDYLDRARDYMKKVSLYIFKTTDAQLKPLSRFPGRFHLFAIDWVLDAQGGIHLLEGNGYPLVTEYPVPGLTPNIWNDLLDLVLKIHTCPAELDPRLTTKSGFTHGKWSIIYNELEEKYRQEDEAENGSEAALQAQAWNPCTVFPQNINAFQ